MLNSHILIVEDSLTQAVKLEFFLVGKGYTVSLASTGEDALELMAGKNIDLVISDVIMPGMDGYELCESIRGNSNYGNVPVILLTSLSDPGDIIKGLKSGATNFVTKPYDEDFLLGRINSVLRDGRFDLDQRATQEVSFDFHGEKHVLRADFSQVFHLLLTTYENTLLQSRQLDAAHRKLVSHEEQLSSVLSSMAAKIAVLGPDLKIMATNESWRALFIPGQSETDITGRDFAEAIAESGCMPESLDALLEGVRSVITGSTGKFSHEYSIEHKAGAEASWYMLEVTPMRGKSGGAVASFIEITERKNMERELIEARDAAEKANRFKSRFLASMSHEIRTPLNAVIGMTDLTLRSELTAEQVENLDIVRVSASQLLTLINDILDLSKVEAKMLKLEKNDFSLSEALYAVVKSMEQQAKDKGLVLSLDLDEDVPEVVCGDEGRLKQILYNLVGNSLKFTDQGGIFVQVSTLDGCIHSGQVLLQVSVRDTGIGIPEDKQAVIFESFRQADDTTTRKFGGTGLGLAISRELVEMMGGEIGVRSSEGCGSVFTFTVFLQPGDPSTLISNGKEKKTVSRADSKVSILLVEDNPINVKVATSLLTKMGHSVTVAGNGVEAISMLPGLSVDLVLMDLEMPEMDGFNASRNIRMGIAGEANRDVPIIAMSAHAMSGIKEKCIKYGMNDYIAKPVRYNELHRIVQDTMKTRTEEPAVEVISGVQTAPILDLEKASDMYHGDSELYSELCSMFLTDVEDEIKSFDHAWSADDRDTARRIAHTLKSSCAAICAPHARVVAMELEKAVLADDPNAVNYCLERFREQSQKIRTALATTEQ
ncbi:response regulator [Maridesulfovibrio sp.]|uniref:response regulator n=1 Tax=Maridesulfovibrio sp. TaxID=2795000 RepID=UPI002A18B6A3|nr:response regulator [Maridesulfovibrio sp.]